MNGEPAPIIVTALFGKADFAYLNTLRRRYYPAERNLVDAHLTLFQHLPPSASEELNSRLNAETRGVRAPEAQLSKVMSLGTGVAFGVDCTELAAMRERMADAFMGLLMPVDQRPWNPHVTIQNKVTPAKADQLREEFLQNFKPRPLEITGLACWLYRNGPWEALSKHRFAR